MTDGYLQLIIGPMFAGKTTTLIEEAKKVRREESLRINHSINIRYNEKHGGNIFCSHDEQVLGDVINLDNLCDITKLDRYKDAKYIFIEELQFFADALEAIVTMVECDGKWVVAAGLDGTYLREPFGDVLKLIPYSDNTVKLLAKCDMCGKDAPFTKKFGGKEGGKGDDAGIEMDIEVGGKDIYVPVCRKHYS